MVIVLLSKELKPVSDEYSQSRHESIERFIESLKHNKSFEAIRNRVRVLPKGLFIDERGVDELVLTFQAWIHSTTQGAADKTGEKTRQWLFQSSEPERLYLVEGKQVLAGHLISVAIQSPQRYGLPYYLGSLLPTSKYLHPADPLLATIPGVTVRQGKLGLEVEVERRGKPVVIPETVLKSFSELAQGSRFLQRRYPGCEAMLPVTLKALVGIARRARVVPKAFPLCVPYDVKVSKSKEVRASGKFVFIEEKGVLTRILEMHARHLSDFLRSELARSPREKLGSFRLTPKHRDIVGFYEIGKSRTAVHARALGEFAELIRRSREPRERFSGWFTSADCFERFSSIFQLAQPIERRKIAASLERFKVDASSFRICGGWIFALSRDQTVMRTLARHVRLPGFRREKSDS